MMHDKWLDSDKHFWFWFQYWDSIPRTNKLKSIKYSVEQWYNTPPELGRRQDIAQSPGQELDTPS